MTIFRERRVQIRIICLRQLTARKEWSIAIALFLLRSLFPTTDNNNSIYSNQLTKHCMWCQLT